ncbi:hypothetical protein MMC28_010282 [Mycoblastus sanguinarius]|nr:hypothetical protein [Mycoblastus sanguinarius]
MGGLAGRSQSDSSYSASESSNDSDEDLSSSRKLSSNDGRPKKRKIRETSVALKPRVKRLKVSYSDEYRKLFNKSIDGLTSETSSTEENLLPASQVGLVFWSSGEKSRFFHSLSKKGRHDLPGISADIGSKSEGEVHVYLRLLQGAALEQQIHRPRNKLPRSFNIDSAVEVGRECCTALDLAAEALSVLQQKEEESVEKRRHGDFALLASQIAKLVDRSFHTGVAGEVDVLQKLPAARLLDLKKFLHLSKHFFMNSTIEENNWRAYTEKRISPSILYTAFSDFYTLVISTTKRLVQSCLFLAMSRLKALDGLGHHTLRRHVRRRDVLAALDVLGMEANAKRFWAGTARKCKLRVYDKVRRRQVSGKRYNYDEVEDSLGYGKFDNTRNGTPLVDVREKSEAPQYQLDESESSNSIDTVSGEDHWSSGISDDLSLFGISSGLSDKQALEQQRLEKSHDGYAEIIDQQASRNEEQYLWELLDKDPAETMKGEDVEIPKAPWPERKDTQDLVDWRSWTDYAGEWETYDAPIPAISFIENQKYGVSRQSTPTTSDSDLSSADIVHNSESTLREHNSGVETDTDSDGDDVDSAL